MPQPAEVFLRLNQEVRGPFGLKLLTELARSGVITPDTEASANAGGPWIPIDMLGDYAAIFPIRPETRFKAAVFENANRSSALPVDHRAIIAAANRPSAPHEDVQPSRSTRVGRPNDVEEILRENTRMLARAEKPLDLTPRPNRRRLDYVITMIVFNGFFVWRLISNWGDPATMMFSLSGIVVVSSGITWVMYGVMDRY